MLTEASTPARLAFLRHAASVRPEPGSNSPSDNGRAYALPAPFIEGMYFRTPSLMDALLAVQFSKTTGLVSPAAPSRTNRILPHPYPRVKAFFCNQEMLWERGCKACCPLSGCSKQPYSVKLALDCQEPSPNRCSPRGVPRDALILPQPRSPVNRRIGPASGRFCSRRAVLPRISG